jgi:DNA polymerase elongation subunit (family B)
VSTDTHVIENVDVSSYYPNLAIRNRFYPEHLTETFCEVYEWIYNERKKHKKGSAENAAYKLALNGTYGASNSEFSPFYDPKFTMSITINGQLQLSYLCDLLLQVDNLELLNINTDGACYYVPRNQLDEVDKVLKQWENDTQLELEKEHYSRMYMRDVNSFILSYED